MVEKNTDYQKIEAKYTLENVCTPGCPCKFKEHNTHLNLVRKNPASELPPVKWVNIRGREEHEAVIRDAALCNELGLNQVYEMMSYLRRWGGWLSK
jgi:hypothetical protein